MRSKGCARRDDYCGHVQRVWRMCRTNAPTALSPVRFSRNSSESKDPLAQYEKTRLITKLRGAREHIRETMGKCEGRKSYDERDPELVAAARRLHRRSPKGHRRSLRDIARELAALGYTNKRGAPYSASCVEVYGGRAGVFDVKDERARTRCSCLYRQQLLS
jgi:hypothetical protein